MLTGPGRATGTCGLMDDVISQGRKSERENRPNLPRRWRVAAGTLAVVAAGLAATGIGLRHGSGSPETATATGGAVSVPFVPAPLGPVPQSHPAYVICAPSTGACSMRARG